MAKGTPATLVLERAGLPHALHAYDFDAAAAKVGLQAAESLGVAPDRVFKTLMAEVTAARGTEVVCAVIPSNREMAMKKLAIAAGAKGAMMMRPEAAERHTGYHVGGISPLGSRKSARIFIDSTATGHGTIFVNGGRRGLQIEIDPGDLIRATGAVLADLAA